MKKILALMVVTTITPACNCLDEWCVDKPKVDVELARCELGIEEHRDEIKRLRLEVKNTRLRADNIEGYHCGKPQATLHLSPVETEDGQFAFGEPGTWTILNGKVVRYWCSATVVNKPKG